VQSDVDTGHSRSRYRGRPPTNPPIRSWRPRRVKGGSKWLSMNHGRGLELQPSAVRRA